MVRQVALLAALVWVIGCGPKPPENSGPLVDALVGKKIIFTGVPPDAVSNTNQPPVRLEYSFKQDGHIKAERVMPGQRAKMMVVIPGNEQAYVMAGLDVKVWQIQGRELVMSKLFSFPKATITKGDKVRSPELPIDNEVMKTLALSEAFIDQSTNVWVYAIEKAR